MIADTLLGVKITNHIGKFLRDSLGYDYSSNTTVVFRIANLDITGFDEGVHFPDMLEISHNLYDF